MRAFIVRFHDPKRGSVFFEIVAATVADAEEDFERLHPGKRIIGTHSKPNRGLLKADLAECCGRR